MAGEPQHLQRPADPLAGAANPPPTRPSAATIAVDGAPVLIWSTSADRSDDWFSASWSSYTGRLVDELKGDGWIGSIHPEDVGRCLGIHGASFEAATPFSLDVRLRRHDGAYRWMLDNGVPRFGDDGKILGFVGTLIDIDERKALEETLAERAQQMRLAERRQGQFLAMLSHELRSPLQPISNAASVLRTIEHTNPILVRLREILDRQAKKLGSLIDELIDVTRAAQGQISLVRGPVSVESIVQAAVASSHEKIIAGGHRLAVEVPDERLFVRGDSTRLAQALAHLIANAAKFSPEPGVVSIAVERAANAVQISVKDHGEGMAASFLPHAFEIFAQQDQTKARRLGGLGVGLTLARRVAELHGGDVEGFSEGPGRGSEFVLWLPLMAPASASDEAAYDMPQLSEGLRVLIVEDDEDSLESLRLQMELWGTEVSKARSAVEALAMAAQVRPQIVLCDIGLPGMDGLRLVQELRRTLAGLPVTFAAVTGYASADDQQRALAAGFDSFFVKPLDPESLSRMLRSYASRSG